jgi:hypothetical protein
MAWEIEYTDEFGSWWETLGEDEQESITASVELLEEVGPRLGFPHTSGVTQSRHGRMRELRVQHRGRPIRVFFAWDPARVGLLLIGGDKTGDDRFYDRMVPIADDLYDKHLDTLLRERNSGARERGRRR